MVARKLLLVLVNKKKSKRILILINASFSQDMWFYLSEHDKFNDFGNEDALIWHESNIPYAVWKPESTRTLSLKYHPSEVCFTKRSMLHPHLN